MYALHQKYIVNAGGILINDEGRKLSLMDSPATPKEINNNEADFDQDTVEVKEIICEIAPEVSYAGEGLEAFVQGKKLAVPALIKELS